MRSPSAKDEEADCTRDVASYSMQVSKEWSVTRIYAGITEVLSGLRTGSIRQPLFFGILQSLDEALGADAVSYSGLLVLVDLPFGQLENPVAPRTDDGNGLHLHSVEAFPGNPLGQLIFFDFVAIHITHPCWRLRRYYIYLKSHFHMEYPQKSNIS